MQRTAPSAPALTNFLPLAAALVVVASFSWSPRPAASGPVATALKSASSTDRRKVRDIYAALADVTQRDAGSRIVSVATWRASHSDALRLAVGGTDLVGKYPGLDTAVEEVLGQYVTLDNVPFTKELTSKLVAGLRAVEAQCE